MDKFLKSYINKYDRWIKEKTISHSSKVIPIKESLNEVQQMIPSNQALDILKNADLITLARCLCRKRYQRCDKPIEVCFILNQVGKKWISKGLSRPIDLKTAEQILKQANLSGLVHLTLYQPDHEIFALCSCCSCCCHDLQLIISFGQEHLLMKSDFIARDDSDHCLNCGQCIERCQFKARHMVEGEMVYLPDKCTGCGLCITTCDVQAIQMEPRHPDT